MISYIYADGQLLDKLSLTDSKETLNLQKVPNAITEGIHELVLVQYSNDQIQNGIPTLKKQKYTVAKRATGQ